MINLLFVLRIFGLDSRVRVLMNTSSIVAITIQLDRLHRLVVIGCYIKCLSLKDFSLSLGGKPWVFIFLGSSD